MSTAVDVWGLGCAMWEAVTRKDLPGDHPVLGERAVQADFWQAEVQSSLMPDFVEGLDDMIRAELEAELGQAGIGELKYQLGVAATPRITEPKTNNRYAALQASDANDEQEEIRMTVESYLTVCGSCSHTLHHLPAPNYP